MSLSRKGHLLSHFESCMIIEERRTFNTMALKHPIAIPNVLDIQ